MSILLQTFERLRGHAYAIQRPSQPLAAENLIILARCQNLEFWTDRLPG